MSKTFTGNKIISKTPSTPISTPVARYSLESYAKYSVDPNPKPELKPSTTSVWWAAYRESLKEKINPFRGAKDTETTVGYSKAAILAGTTLYFRIQSMINSSAFGAGGDPDEMLNLPPGRAADKYMAECITKQYKMTAAPYGTYNLQCTEGTIRGQADYARSLALSAQFRMKQRSTAQKFGDFCETRRKAMIAANGCNYEENLITKYPISARAFVIGGSEAKGVCVRYARGSTAAEEYMTSSVDKQMKFKAVPRGVYDVLCNDGNAKDVAEYKRVQSLAVRYRSNQLSKVVKEGVKFESAKYARDFFGHGCDYEEKMFNKYPAVAASMRPSTARY